MAVIDQDMRDVVERAAAIDSHAYTWGGASEQELAVAWAARYLEAAGVSARDLEAAGR